MQKTATYIHRHSFIQIFIESFCSSYHSCILLSLFVCFVLRHINLIGHLMPNQVKENKSEKKFKGEIIGIDDKL